MGWFYALLFIILFSFGSSKQTFEQEFKESFSIEQISYNHPRLKTLKKFDVIFPTQFSDEFRQIRKENLKTYLDYEEKIHHLNAYFDIKINGVTYPIDLKLNEYLFPKISESQPANSIEDHCYYHGKVKNHESSLVVISTCNGLRGVLVIEEQIFMIEPLSQDMYVAYQPHHDMGYRGGSCGNSDGNPMIELQSILRENRAGNATLARNKRSIENEKKFVELLLVVDKAEADKFESRVELDARMKELVNYLDGFYNQLGIRIVLSHIEVWKNGDKVPLGTNANEVLNDFLAYYQQQKRNSPPDSPWRRADNVQLIYGGSFDGSTIGMASVGSMCGSRSGGVNQDHNSNVAYTAATLAHEMGHNFGMLHDTADCTCPAGAQCVMASSSGFSLERAWSSCSREYLSQNQKLGLGNCLLNVPDPSTIYGGPQCGNDIIEKGEECDCGTVEDCTSKCCNASTCMLYDGASCDTGTCCNDCQYTRSGTICRSTEGNKCELPEYCTGLSANCPGNVYLQDGSPCKSGEATCNEGVCLTRDLQCLNIWGTAPDGNVAGSSVETCYTLVNALGDWNGNCGKNNNGEFIKCSAENAMCGKLQCAGGNRRPLVGADRHAFRNILTGSKEECKTISSDDNATDVQDPGLVKDGTMCGTNQICQEGVCAELEESTCSDSCSGNGVCNNLGNCHCDCNWAPPYCSIEGYGGSVNSGPACATGADIQMILMIVMFLVVLPIILALLSWVWYRYCGGKRQVLEWRKNRRDRLEAVARSKKPVHAKAGNGSQENLFDAPKSNNERKLRGGGIHIVQNYPSNTPPSKPAPPRPSAPTNYTPTAATANYQDLDSNITQQHGISPSKPIRTAPPPPPSNTPYSVSGFNGMPQNTPTNKPPPPPPAITKPTLPQNPSSTQTCQPTFFNIPPLPQTLPPPPVNKPPVPQSKPQVAPKIPPAVPCNKPTNFKPTLPNNKPVFHGSTPVINRIEDIHSSEQHQRPQSQNFEPENLSVFEKAKRFNQI